MLILFIYFFINQNDQFFKMCVWIMFYCFTVDLVFHTGFKLVNITTIIFIIFIIKNPYLEYTSHCQALLKICSVVKLNCIHR